MQIEKRNKLERQAYAQGWLACYKLFSNPVFFWNANYMDTEGEKELQVIEGLEIFFKGIAQS